MDTKPLRVLVLKLFTELMMENKKTQDLLSKPLNVVSVADRSIQDPLDERIHLVERCGDTRDVLRLRCTFQPRCWSHELFESGRPAGSALGADDAGPVANGATGHAG